MKINGKTKLNEKKENSMYNSNNSEKTLSQEESTDQKISQSAN